MKLTANELRHRCIDGERWRLSLWDKGKYIYFCEREDAFMNSDGFRLRSPIIESTQWEKYVEKKPFPFKDGDPVLVRAELGDTWNVDLFKTVCSGENYPINGYTENWKIIAPLSKEYINKCTKVHGSITADDLHLYDLRGVE